MVNYGIRWCIWKGRSSHRWYISPPTGVDPPPHPNVLLRLAMFDTFEEARTAFAGGKA